MVKLPLSKLELYVFYGYFSPYKLQSIILNNFPIKLSFSNKQISPLCQSPLSDTTWRFEGLWPMIHWDWRIYPSHPTPLLGNPRCPRIPWWERCTWTRSTRSGGRGRRRDLRRCVWWRTWRKSPVLVKWLCCRYPGTKRIMQYNE